MANSIEITPVEPEIANFIRGYGDGGFRIGANDHRHGSVLLVTDQVIDWRPPVIELLSMNDLGPIIDKAPEVDILVFGCGGAFTAPPKLLRNDLRTQGVVLEWMDTGAACRTFNVLLSEARQVAAALIAID